MWYDSAEMIEIRPETPADYDAVYVITEAAFENSAEAKLNNALRAANAAHCSLVAMRAGTLIGHIMFSPATITAGDTIHPTIALGPVAIAPAAQNQGVGSQLIHTGLAACRDMGNAHVFLLGHTNYYPRFGFQQADTTFGIHWVGNPSTPAFMGIELVPHSLDHLTGTMRFHPAFDTV